jgi:hypothetical protein
VLLFAHAVIISREEDRKSLLVPLEEIKPSSALGASTSSDQVSENIASEEKFFDEYDTIGIKKTLFVS